MLKRLAYRAEIQNFWWIMFHFLLLKTNLQRENDLLGSESNKQKKTAVQSKINKKGKE